MNEAQRLLRDMGVFHEREGEHNCLLPRGPAEK